MKNLIQQVFLLLFMNHRSGIIIKGLKASPAKVEQIKSQHHSTQN